VENSDSHYTAVILADQRVYQIKSPTNPNTKTFFDTVETWLAFLPGAPQKEDLQVTTKQSHKEKEKEKEPKPKKRTFHVPNHKVSATALKWGRHIYYSIKKHAPTLLKREDVLEAYNEFIRVLAVPQSTVTLHLQTGSDKYLRMISMENHMILPVQYSVMWRYRVMPFQINTEEYNKSLEDKKATDQIVQGYHDAYMPLYELIKRDIVPIIEEIKDTIVAKRCITQTEKEMIMMIQQKIKLEGKVSHCDRWIQIYQTRIQELAIRPPKTFSWDKPEAEKPEANKPCPICAKSQCTSGCNC
jgi:hypothetical protein